MNKKSKEVYGKLGLYVMGSVRIREGKFLNWITRTRIMQPIKVEILRGEGVVKARG